MLKKATYLLILSMILTCGLFSSVQSKNETPQTKTPEIKYIELLIDSVKNMLYVSPQKSLELSKKVLELAIKSDSKTHVAAAYNYIGTACQNLNQWDKAIDYFLKALKTYKEVPNNEEKSARMYNNIGIVYYSVKEYTPAMKYFNDALKIYKANKIKKGVGRVMNNMGNVYLDNKNYKKALFCFNESLKAYNEDGDTLIISSPLNNIGLVFIGLNQLDSAHIYLYKALNIKKKNPIRDDQGIGNTLINIGRNYLLQKKYDLAFENLSQGLKLVESVDNKEFIMECYLYMSQLYSAKKDTVNSMKYYILYSNLNNTLLTQDIKNRITIKQWEYNNFITEKEIKHLRVSRNYQFAILVFIVLFLVLCVYILKNKLKVREKLYLAEQKALTAQMNPHFIFNSLASIQSLILQKDFEKADKYLTKFSKLFRTILDNSTLKTISLADQLKNVQLYVETEMMRFGDKFDFVVDITPDIDPSEIFIPPMLIQPYIENSILHGLANKKEKGVLKISIKNFDKNVILCSIEDDGIGRTKSGEINIKRKGHKSVGVKNSEERIRLINQLHNNKLNVNITDLYPDKEETGTKVELYVSY